MSGLSYIVLANFRIAGSGVETENSLYPCIACKEGIAEAEMPALIDVRKWVTVSCYTSLH